MPTSPLPPVPARRRDPDAVRAALVEAVTALLASGRQVSIGAVAEQAGVSKGAVQHHFGTRAQMLDAVMDTCMQEFADGLDAVRAAGETDAARAYLRATVHSEPTDGRTRWQAMLAAAVVERAVAQRWAAWVARDREQDAAPDTDSRALILRLAADGLWLSDLLGIYRIDAEQRARLEADLLALSAGPHLSPAPTQRPRGRRRTGA